jgi:hypothetical protein
VLHCCRLHFRLDDQERRRQWQQRQHSWWRWCWWWCYRTPPWFFRAAWRACVTRVHGSCAQQTRADRSVRNQQFSQLVFCFDFLQSRHGIDRVSVPHIEFLLIVGVVHSQPTCQLSPLITCCAPSLVPPVHRFTTQPRLRDAQGYDCTISWKTNLFYPR